MSMTEVLAQRDQRIAELERQIVALVDESMQQAKTIRLLIERGQPGAVEPIDTIGDRLGRFYGANFITMDWLVERLDAPPSYLRAIMAGDVVPTEKLRQRIEDLIGGAA